MGVSLNQNGKRKHKLRFWFQQLLLMIFVPTLQLAVTVHMVKTVSTIAADTASKMKHVTDLRDIVLMAVRLVGTGKRVTEVRENMAWINDKSIGFLIIKNYSVYIHKVWFPLYLAEINCNSWLCRNWRNWNLNAALSIGCEF